MIYSDNTYDITQDISTYTRTDFKSVYDTSRSKWYMLNNLNEYEEYGIYGDSLSGTYYTGKLVMVNDEEYEWDGTLWVDLGGYITVNYPYIQFPNATSYSNSAYFDTGTPLKNTYTLEVKLKTPASNGSKYRQVIGNYENWSSLNTNEFAIYTNGSNNSYFGMNWWNYGSARGYKDSAFAMAANTEYIIKIHVGTGVTYINGVLQSTSGGTNANGTLSTNMRICSGFTLDPGFNGRIYYVKITEGDTLIANYEATNSNSTPGFINTVSEIKYTKSGSGTVSYGEDSDTVIPKEYTPKSTPSITNVWPSKWYRNSIYMYKLYRNDVEQALMNYMSDDKYNKEEIPVKGAIQFPSNPGNKANSAWFYGPHIKNTDTIEVKFVIDSWNGWCLMLGCNVNNNSQEFQFSIYPASGGTQFGQNFWDYGTSSRLWNDYMFNVSANTEHILRIQVGTGDILLDGGSIISGDGNNATGTSYEALQFGCAPASAGDPGFPGKIYYLKIYDSDNNLIFDAEATNADNNPGFIDTVSGNRCTKGGNGTVTFVVDE